MLEVVPEYPFELVPGENAVKDVGIVPGVSGGFQCKYKDHKVQDANKQGYSGRKLRTQSQVL